VGITCSDLTDTLCTNCSAGYYLVQTAGAPDQCPSCPAVSNCAVSLTCTTSTDVQCLTCSPGYFRVPGSPDTCSQCPSITNCASGQITCSSTVTFCGGCVSGTYFVSGGGTSDDQCLTCTSITLCTAVSCSSASNSQCTTCQSPYRVSSDGTSCEEPCVAVTNCAVTVTCLTGTNDNICTSCASGYVRIVEDSVDDRCVLTNLCDGLGCATGYCNWDPSNADVRVCYCGAEFQIHGGPYDATITLVGGQPFSGCTPYISNGTALADDLAHYPDYLSAYIFDQTGVTAVFGALTGNTIDVTLTFPAGADQVALKSRIQDIITSWTGAAVSLDVTSTSGDVATAELTVGAISSAGQLVLTFHLLVLLFSVHFF